MKIIKAVCGKDIIVDDADLNRLIEHSWYIKSARNTFYAFTLINGKEIRMHILILNISDKKQQIDHKDGNGLNNSKTNLRPCTHGQNGQNKSGYGKSKYKGVTLESGKWRARLIINGKKTSLGTFAKEEDAANAVNKAIEESGNSFYRRNIIPNN